MKSAETLLVLDLSPAESHFPSCSPPLCVLAACNLTISPLACLLKELLCVLSTSADCTTLLVPNISMSTAEGLFKFPFTNPPLKASSFLSVSPPSFSRPPLILVSLDGFRAGYLKDHGSHLPVINKLRKSPTSWTPQLFMVCCVSWCD